MNRRLAGLAARNAPTIGAFVLAAVVFGFATIYKSSFSSMGNVQQLLVFASFLGIASLGQFAVILAGGFDLSLPWMIGFGGVFLTKWTSSGMPDAVAIALLVLCGAGIGLVNGLGVTRLGISPIIMTLGTGGVVNGLLLYAGLNSSQNAGVPHVAETLADDKLLGVPLLAIIWIALAVLAGWVLTRTAYGRRLYAVGMNDAAAWKAGIQVVRVRALTYVISAVCAVFGGVVLTGYIGLSYVDMGSPYLFGSIAAVAVGGSSVLGGRGSYWGTVAGALTLTFISALLPVLNIGSSALQIFYGGVIILGVGLSRYTTKLVHRRRPPAAGTATAVPESEASL